MSPGLKIMASTGSVAQIFQAKMWFLLHFA